MSLDIHLLQRLQKKIDQEAKQKSASICMGQMEADAYKFECGYLKALSDVSVWTEEIEKQLSEGK